MKYKYSVLYSSRYSIGTIVNWILHWYCTVLTPTYSSTLLYSSTRVEYCVRVLYSYSTVLDYSSTVQYCIYVSTLTSRVVYENLYFCTSLLLDWIIARKPLVIDFAMLLLQSYDCELIVLNTPTAAYPHFEKFITGFVDPFNIAQPLALTSANLKTLV
jgi:hypothetical protein